MSASCGQDVDHTKEKAGVRLPRDKLLYEGFEKLLYLEERRQQELSVN